MMTKEGWISQFVLDEAVLQLSAEQQAALEAARDQVLGTAAELDTLPIVMEAMRDYHLLTFLRSVGCVCKHWHRVWQQTDSCLARLKRLCDEYDAVYDPMAGNTQAAATVAHELLDVLWLDHPGRLAQSIVSSVYNYRYTPDGRPILSGIGNIINAMLREGGWAGREARKSLCTWRVQLGRTVYCVRPTATLQYKYLPQAALQVQEETIRQLMWTNGKRPEWAKATPIDWTLPKWAAWKRVMPHVKWAHLARLPKGPYATDGKIGINGYKYYVCVEPAPNPNRCHYTLVWIPPEAMQWVTPAEGPDNHHLWQEFVQRAPTHRHAISPTTAGWEKHVAFEDTLSKRLDCISRA